jgi:hypothetical protein
VPEAIHKLQPNRTLSLRGFDHLGASAALHSATATEFKVSGVFRDPADFAVLILHDADNFYEHPRLRYLPDFDFSNLVLTFDVKYEGLMPLSSPKFPTIDWPYLDVIRADGSTAKIRLSDYGSAIDSGDVAAEAAFTIVDASMKEFDRLTLWYLNIAYDYLVPKVECAFGFVSSGAGNSHTVTVGGTAYTYVEAAGDTNTSVAQGVVNALLACPDVSATRGDGSAELGPANQVNVRAKRTDGLPIVVSSGTTSYTIYGVGASTVAAVLAAQINATNWTVAGALIPIRAEATGAAIRVIANVPGIDGNMLAMYSNAKNTRLRTASEVVQFSGGTSDGTWRITLDFSALGISQVRLMWLTFAPPLANGAAFTSTEWLATFTNWSVSGPAATRALRVAGPLSVRVEENDSWCSYTGSWGIEAGFFSDGFAKRSSTPGDSITIRYTCPGVHDLYLGTSLYSDRGAVLAQLDGDTATRLDCVLPTAAAVNTRRRIRAGVAAGNHTVVLRLDNTGYFYFDFLEAVVPSDVPDALPPRPNLSPALDYSTDHTYKLAPARILWNFDKLGFSGPMNEYAGVFWWNQRAREGASFPSAEITFSGTFAEGDALFVNISGQVCGKVVFPNETNAIIARHFAMFINANYVGVWASAASDKLTIVCRSPEPAYSFTLTVSKESPTNSSGNFVVTGQLSGGNPGKWMVDPSQTTALNRGARDWHADFFRECRLRNREIVVATSMELVNPPAGFAAVYYDGKIVETDVGFGSLKSTHCAFVPSVLEFQKSVYTTLAGLMADAGLTPSLQFGEFLWWFFTNKNASNPGGGMAFYHPEITSAAQAQLGRPLVRFESPVDDPLRNDGADAIFLRSRLRDHVSALISHIRGLYSTARLELLFPYDVNHPTPAGIHQIGGRLNRFINLPLEWESKTSSNLDSIKTEALDFGAWSRDLNLARTAIKLPLELGWPRDSVRHLVPVFRGGYAWEKEVEIAEASGIPAVNLWAFDHVCIFGWPPSPAGERRSMRI